MNSKREVTVSRFGEILDAYGAEPQRWPVAEREAALALLARSAPARQQQASAAALDAFLDRADVPAPSADLKSRALAAGAANTAKAGQAHATEGRPKIVSRRPWGQALGMAAPLAAAAMLVLWLALPEDPHREVPTPLAATDSFPALLHAFADPDLTRDPSGSVPPLPDGYLAVASAFDVPVNDY